MSKNTAIAMAAKTATAIPTPIPAFAPVERPPLEDATGVGGDALSVGSVTPDVEDIEDVVPVALLVVVVLVAFGFVATWFPFRSRYTPCLAWQHALLL